MALSRTEATRLISLALADKIVGAKVSINTLHPISLDTLVGLLNRVHEGTTFVTTANFDENGDWHFDVH
jgi:hypothetical protein